MKLDNCANLHAAAITRLEREVEGQEGVGDVIAYLQRSGAPSLIPDLVIQDEYSHDLTFPLAEGLYLVYATT